MILDKTVSNTQAFLMKYGEDSLNITNILINIAKIMIIFAGPLGLLILAIYSYTLNAPLPISDISSVTSLLIIAAVYGFIVEILAFIILLFPAFFCYVSEKERQNIGAPYLGVDAWFETDRKEFLGKSKYFMRPL